MFKHEPCECEPGACLKGVDPAEDCVNRLQGVVEPIRCEKCGGDTLHHNGECLRCKRITKIGEPPGIIPDTLPWVNPKPPQGLYLEVSLGGAPIRVDNKALVLKIVKMIMEGK